MLISSFIVPLTYIKIHKTRTSNKGNLYQISMDPLQEKGNTKRMMILGSCAQRELGVLMFQENGFLNKSARLSCSFYFPLFTHCMES